MKHIIVCLMLIALLSLPVQIFAKDNSNITVLLEGEQLQFSTKPFIQDGVTLVQFRPLFEKLGLAVEWDANKKTITSSKEGLTITLQINNKIAWINGIKLELEVAPQIVNGDTLVPIRIVAETVDRNVAWNSETEQILIEKKAEVDYDFRNVKWDFSKEEVRKVELAEIIPAERDMKYHLNSDWYKNVQFLNYNCYLVYNYYDDDLIGAGYYINDNVTFDAFYELKGIFTQQYGEPYEDYEKTLVNGTYSSLFAKGGYINASVQWKSAKTKYKTIQLNLSGENFKLIGIGIGYDAYH